MSITGLSASSAAEFSSPPQNDAIHQGSCFCGEVTYTVTGRPILSAYCHCTLCQRLNQSPFVHTLQFSESAFAWTHAKPHQDVLETFTIPQKPWKTRWRCRECGVCVTSHNSKANKWSVWAAHLERDAEGRIRDCDDVKPTAHIFYGTRMLEINDDLPKWDGYEKPNT